MVMLVGLQTNRGRLPADSEHVHSSSNMMPYDVFAGHAPSSHAVSAVQPTDNQLMEDTKMWQWHQSYQQPQQQQHQNIVHFNEEHAVLVPTRTEQLPRDIQQSMLPMVQQHFPMNGGTASHRADDVLPAPVRDIYQRLVDKQQQVASLSSDSDNVSQLLNDVQRGE